MLSPPYLRADGVDLGLQGLVVRAQRGELTSLVQAGAKETGDLLNHGLGGQELVVLLRQLLDQLLVLVQLLESLGLGLALFTHVVLRSQHHLM